MTHAEIYQMIAELMIALLYKAVQEDTQLPVVFWSDEVT